MKIAIFADIHGKFLLPFKLVDFYQKETSKKIDLILQCGDMGAFPDIKNLDKATIRHAKYDREELGFYDEFTQEKAEVRELLNTLNINMICVRGNHEDHTFLDNLEKVYAKEVRFPIDVYKRIWVCKTGFAQTFELGDEKLSFVGIGRIGDRKGRDEAQFIQEYEKKQLRKLLKTREHFDILLTHDKDSLSERGYGMEEILDILTHLIFHYQFHGHTGEPFNQRFAHNGITQICKIKELEFDENGMLGAGCMLILDKIGEDKFELEIVPQTLTNRITKHNWRY